MSPAPVWPKPRRAPMTIPALIAALLLLAAAPAAAQPAQPLWPNLRAGDIVNGVVLLHGTSGSGADWLRASLANELFGAGQPLDASKYFIILPDGIGRGGSSKPSDGLRA